MPARDVTSESLRYVLAKHDRVGCDAFLREYGYGKATRYVLVHEGRFYDPKAIVGAAHIEATGRRWESLSGGDLTSDVLSDLGYAVYRLQDLNAQIPGPDRVDVELLDDFVMIPVGEEDELDETEEPETEEGRRVMREHTRIERNRTLVRLKKAAVMRSTGELRCEVCGLEPGELFGPVGVGLVEVHHTTPLHVSGPTVTRLRNLAIVCPTCHRVIHRHDPVILPAELRRRLASTRR